MHCCILNAINVRLLASMSYFKINNKYIALLPESLRIQTLCSVSWQTFKLMLHIIIHSQQSIITEEPQIKNKYLAHNDHQGHHACGQIQMLKLKVLHMFFINFRFAVQQYCLINYNINCPFTAFNMRKALFSPPLLYCYT